MRVPITAIGLASAGSFLVLMGSMWAPWLSGSPGGASNLEGHTLEVGLRAISVCSPDCTTIALGADGLGATHLPIVGFLTTMIGLLCVVGVVCLLAQTLRRFLSDHQPATMRVALSTLAILASGLALVAAVIAVSLFSHDFKTGAGSGFFSYGIGASIALYGSIVMGRLPPDDRHHFDPPFDSV